VGVSEPCPPPAELHWLSDAIGAVALLRLIELHGGCRIYVPREVNQGTKLAREIGLAPARALSALRGGEGFRVPLARVWRVSVYRTRGDSYGQIARRLGVTEKCVAELLWRLRMTREPPLNRKRGAARSKEAVT
jgi:hypothetical protein